MTRRGRAGPRVVAALVVVLIGILWLAACGGEASDGAIAAPDAGGPAARVTFVELGSDSCIPCKEMKPVMAGIQKTFGDQVEIVFYDVWEDDAPAREYGISMIPTQVFLDDKGVEFHRHTGFYPQEEIEALLVEHGLTRLTAQ